MMVCMPAAVLLRTLSVLGRGWHWCAEARAALRTQTDWELERAFPPEPYPPLQAGGQWWSAPAVCQVGAILPVVDVRKAPIPDALPITARQGLKDTGMSRAADRWAGSRVASGLPLPAPGALPVQVLADESLPPSWFSGPQPQDPSSRGNSRALRPSPA